MTTGAGTEVTLEALVRAAITHAASDIHLHEGRPVGLRVDGTVGRLGTQPVPSGWIDANVVALLSPGLREVLHRDGNVEAGFESNGYRVRASIGTDHGGRFAVFRLLPPTIPTTAQVGVPAAVMPFMAKSQGLLLIAGATGSGKSTTCASLLASLEQSRAGLHVLTLEDPIEYILPAGDNVITQRELHTHYADFDQGLRQAVRQDPDVIFIGELRDPSSATAAISAAGSGHLVVATIHAYDAVSAVDSLLWLAGVEDKPQVRTQISHVLLAVVSQRLVKLKAGSRVAVFEMLANTEPVSTLIVRADGLAELPAEMAKGSSVGHVQLEESLAELFVDDRIDQPVAMATASDVKRLWSHVSYLRGQARHGF